MSFGKVSKYILSEGEALFIPSHYAHGYECLSSKCSVLYHLEKYRNAKYESGIKFDDKKLKIKWKTKGTKLYQELPQECKNLMKECKPLTEIEKNRKEKQKIIFETWKKSK